MALDKPFLTDGTVKSFPQTLPNHALVLRIENISGAIVYVGFGSHTPSSGAADMVLYSGEAYEIDYVTAKNVSVINDAAATPRIWWHTKKSNL